jgi:dipeptidyl-peptidase-3
MSFLDLNGIFVRRYIGFLEPYRDPTGIRGEFEAFVGILNKETGDHYESLVAGAKDFVACLPWPKEFEKDTFLWPEFAELEVLAYGGSGVYVGVNIPNCE